EDAEEPLEADDVLGVVVRVSRRCKLRTLRVANDGVDAVEREDIQHLAPPTQTGRPDMGRVVVELPDLGRLRLGHAVASDARSATRSRRARNDGAPSRLTNAFMA